MPIHALTDLTTDEPAGVVVADPRGDLRLTFVDVGLSDCLALEVIGSTPAGPIALEGQMALEDVPLLTVALFRLCERHGLAPFGDDGPADLASSRAGEQAGA